MNIVQNQGQLPQWANNYLQYIQVPIREASLEYLTEICTAHHQRVPFENITTLRSIKNIIKRKIGAG